MLDFNLFFRETADQVTIYNNKLLLLLLLLFFESALVVETLVVSLFAG